MSQPNAPPPPINAELAAFYDIPAEGVIPGQPLPIVEALLKELVESRAVADAARCDEVDSEPESLPNTSRIDEPHVQSMRFNAENYAMCNSSLVSSDWAKFLHSFKDSQMNSAQIETLLKSKFKELTGKDLLVFNSTDDISLSHQRNDVITLEKGRYNVTKWLLSIYAKTKPTFSYHTSQFSDYVPDYVLLKEQFKLLSAALPQLNSLKFALSNYEDTHYGVATLFRAVDQVYYEVSIGLYDLPGSVSSSDVLAYDNCDEESNRVPFEGISNAFDMLTYAIAPEFRHVLCETMRQVEQIFAMRYIPVISVVDHHLIRSCKYVKLLTPCQGYYILKPYVDYVDRDYTGMFNKHLLDFYRATDSVPALGVHLRLYNTAEYNDFARVLGRHLFSSPLRKLDQPSLRTLPKEVTIPMRDRLATRFPQGVVKNSPFPFFVDTGLIGCLIKMTQQWKLRATESYYPDEINILKDDHGIDMLVQGAATCGADLLLIIRTVYRSASLFYSDPLDVCIATLIAVHRLHLTKTYSHIAANGY